MKHIFLILLVAIRTNSFGQSKEIAPSIINDLLVKDLFCFDSLGYKTHSCSLGLDGFNVEFIKAVWENNSNKLTLVGHLNPPLPYVGLYFSDSNRVEIARPVCFTSFGEDDMSKDGNFKISISLTDKLSLYFFDQYHFVKQFEIYQLRNLIIK